MKLYVWNNPYEVNYGGSCLYVIAENLRLAREQAKTALDASYGSISPGTRENNGFVVDKIKPTRVHKLPHAEMYHWEE